MGCNNDLNPESTEAPLSESPVPTPTEPPNNPPIVEITSPADGSIFMCDGYDPVLYATITFQGTAMDQEDEDGTLLVEWFSSTDGKLGEGRDMTARVHMQETCNESIDITLRVTDSESLYTEVTIQIYLYIVC